MRAVRVSEPGGPEAMRLENVEVPEPGHGEVRVRVVAAGVNFVDVYFRSGLYPASPPFTPGMEAAGLVDAIGPGVTEVAEGDQVAYSGTLGAYAEYTIVPAPELVAVPSDLELETAAAIMLQGMTAHYLATSTYALGPDDTALVHAGAGGVGLLLTQIAKRRGATVYTTVSTDEKAALSTGAGADHVIRYTEVDFAERVAELMPGGVDVVYDSVGRDTFDRSLDCIRPRGLAVLYGQSSGPVDPVDPQRLNAAGSLYLTRPKLANYTANPHELASRATDLFDWVRDGDLAVRIGETHPLEEAATAHRRLEGRETTGKVLLTT